MKVIDSKNTVIRNVFEYISIYLKSNYSEKEYKLIMEEFINLLDYNTCIDDKVFEKLSYKSLQKLLSNINEKENVRKNKGVYYTPHDTVKFIVNNLAKMSCGKLKSNNLHVQDLNSIPYTEFCYRKTIYDPTCGTGEFLLVALQIKLDLLDLHYENVTREKIKKVVMTLYGNDINEDSIKISKARMLLSILNRFGVKKIQGIFNILNDNFTSYDYVMNNTEQKNKYDIILGNPPYVEDYKSGLDLKNKYGNIYANVLYNSSHQLNKDGVIGFVIPLSYISTPRMKKIRNDLRDVLKEQYILSYSDRPDCLFTSVHQKLCILFAGGNSTKNKNNRYYTSNYKYWYKEERDELFDNSYTVLNPYTVDEYIPKLGSNIDKNIYSKIINNSRSLKSALSKGSESIYLNMRAAFWIKVFKNKQKSSEYKKFSCNDESERNFLIALLNSSLFWWFWVAVSDCWHITNKELIAFKVPNNVDYNFEYLVQNLENKLENTKLFVGTKQTNYEYKHKYCIKEINDIDDVINKLYGLTNKESLYIKNFASIYRQGGQNQK